MISSLVRPDLCYVKIVFVVRCYAECGIATAIRPSLRLSL